MAALQHLACLSARPPTAASSHIRFSCSRVHFLFPLALYLSPQGPQLLIPFFPHWHHSNADYIHYLTLPGPALPALTLNHPLSALLSQLFPQISGAHMANLIHIPSDTPASSARQQVVAVGNPSQSLFSTATDNPYLVARPHTKLKWNVKSSLTASGGKTLL
jgi:hypothetical protein